MIRFAETRPALARDRVRREILDHVDRNGPGPVTALPHRWPLTGFHVRAIAGELAREGLVSLTRGDDAPPLLAITETGRALLRAPSRGP